MMLVYTCKKCKSAYLVSGLDADVHLLQKQMRCPNSEVCGGKIRIYASSKIRVTSTQRVSAVHLYQACMGAGLPHEKRCSPDDLKKLLLGSIVVSAQLESCPDPKRSLIMSLTLNNGKILHFASSTKGATIFKVTEAR